MFVDIATRQQVGERIRTETTSEVKCRSIRIYTQTCAYALMVTIAMVKPAIGTPGKLEERTRRVDANAVLLAAVPQ